MSEEAKVRDGAAAGRSGPDLGRREILVPGGHGTAFVARAGQLVEIEDVEGQVADFVAFAERNRTEWLSTTHTRSAILRLTVQVGDRLDSNWRRPMFEILRDDVGRNDIITSMCDDRRYRLDYGVEGHRSCRTNFTGRSSLVPTSAKSSSANPPRGGRPCLPRRISTPHPTHDEVGKAMSETRGRADGASRLRGETDGQSSGHIRQPAPRTRRKYVSKSDMVTDELRELITDRQLSPRHPTSPARPR